MFDVPLRVHGKKRSEILSNVRTTLRLFVSLSSPNEDLSRLGSGERNSAEGEGPRGPSERERASHWAGVRSLRAHGEIFVTGKVSTEHVRCFPAHGMFPRS